ncbi:PorV/PorQ family protein [bacterium]|nr:PorV/PorQ family protein [bacterium]
MRIRQSNFKMMKRRIFILLAIGLLFWTTENVKAGPFTQDETGTTAAVFLKAPISPRSIGMGRAFTAVANGPEAVWWNPGGLLAFPRREILLENSLWMNELMLNTVAYMEPLSEDHVLGFMINHMTFSTPMTGYDNTGNLIGDIGFTDMAFSLCYATNVFEIPFGINAKLISSSLDDVLAIGVAGDVGVIQGFFKDDLLVGLSLKNFGTKLKWLEEAFALPFAMHLGVAYRLINRDLTLAGDIQMPFDQPPHYHLGVELARKVGMAMKFAVRIGYHTDWQGYSDALNGVNAGIGWEWRIHRRLLSRKGRMIGYKQKLLFLLGLDYAWTPNEQLEPSHRFGLRIGF